MYSESKSKSDRYSVLIARILQASSTAFVSSLFMGFVGSPGHGETINISHPRWSNG